MNFREPAIGTSLSCLAHGWGPRLKVSYILTAAETSLGLYFMVLPALFLKEEMLFVCQHKMCIRSTHSTNFIIKLLHWEHWAIMFLLKYPGRGNTTKVGVFCFWGFFVLFKKKKNLNTIRTFPYNVLNYIIRFSKLRNPFQDCHIMSFNWWHCFFWIIIVVTLKQVKKGLFRGRTREQLEVIYRWEGAPSKSFAVTVGISHFDTSQRPCNCSGGLKETKWEGPHSQEFEV